MLSVQTQVSINEAEIQKDQDLRQAQLGHPSLQSLWLGQPPLYPKSL